MMIAFIPSLFVLIAAVFFYWNFARGGRSSWWKLCLGVIATLLVFIQLVYWVVWIDSGDLLAFISAIYAACIALPSGLLFLLLPGRTGKVVGLWMGILIPVLMFITIRVAQDFSPSSVLRQNGIQLATAIDQYKKDLGRYPQTLEELLPIYVTDLKKPDDSWGWLYLSTDQDFTLGYVFYVGKSGYSVCVIGSTSRNWDCLMDSTVPFRLEPTPFPTGAPSDEFCP